MSVDGVSERASRLATGSRTTFLDTAFMKWYENKFHPDLNPQGVVNLGTAENRLMEDVLTKRLKQIWNYEPDCQYYFDKQGLPPFRRRLADLLTRRLRSDEPLDPQRLVVVNGATTALDALAHVLADEGDAFLGTTPCYRRIEGNLGDRSRVKMIPVPLASGSSPPFRFTLADLARVLKESRSQGEKVRGLVLMNPHNPLGTLLTRDELLSVLDFAHSHDLHLVIDEVFAMSVFEGGEESCSIASLSRRFPDPSRVHFYWSFSKDLCLSGFRCAVVYSWNPAVVSALSGLSQFTNVPAPIQRSLDLLVTDTDWLETEFFPVNLRRLKAAHDELEAGLKSLGITVLQSSAGFCLWANLNEFATARSSSIEETTGSPRDFCRDLLEEAGCYIVPGDVLLCGESGWTRILFATSAEERREFLKRLCQFKERSIGKD